MLGASGRVMSAFLIGRGTEDIHVFSNRAWFGIRTQPKDRAGLSCPQSQSSDCKRQRLGLCSFLDWANIITHVSGRAFFFALSTALQPAAKIRTTWVSPRRLRSVLQSDTTPDVVQHAHCRHDPILVPLSAPTKIDTLQNPLGLGPTETTRFVFG